MSDLTYEQWLDAGDPDFLLLLQAPQLAGGQLVVVLTCHQERYVQATAAADASRARAALLHRPVAELVGVEACPLPLSPLEWEAIEEALLRTAVDEELAERGLGDTVERGRGEEETSSAALAAPQSPKGGQGPPPPRLVGQGAYRRALNAAMAALEVKRQMGGRVEAFAAEGPWGGRPSPVDAWRAGADADWAARVREALGVGVVPAGRGRGQRRATA